MDEPPSSRNGSRSDDPDPQPSFFKSFTGWLRSLGRPRSDEGLRESLEEFIEQAEESGEPLHAERQTMLRNVIDFSNREAEDVMVPRADIVATRADTSLPDIVAAMAEAGHSRLPVHRETLDDVIGMVHVRDLLPYWGDREAFAIEKVLRELLFVPPSMPIDELLRQMRAEKTHMALVVDEHGGTDGLITIEDVVEEIVGEIEDEHDDERAPGIAEAGPGRLEADARVPVADLEARVGAELLPRERHDEIDTLGGLVFDLAGRVPVRGEFIKHPSGLAFEILDADPRRVHKLRVHLAEAGRAAPTAAAG